MRFLLTLALAASTVTVVSAQIPNLSEFEGTIVTLDSETYTGKFIRGKKRSEQKSAGNKLLLPASLNAGIAEDVTIDPVDVFILTIAEDTFYSVRTSGIDADLELARLVGGFQQDNFVAALYNASFAWEGYSYGSFGITFIKSTDFGDKSVLINNNPNKMITKKFAGCPNMVTRAENKEYSGKTPEGVLEIFTDYRACKEAH